jgi:chorismate mutase
MNLQELRKKIDSIHAEMLVLLGKRLQIAKQIAVEKKKKGLPILDFAREEAVKETVRLLAKEQGLSPTIIEEIFTMLMDYSRLEMELHSLESAKTEAM